MTSEAGSTTGPCPDGEGMDVPGKGHLPGEGSAAPLVTQEREPPAPEPHGAPGHGPSPDTSGQEGIWVDHCGTCPAPLAQREPADPPGSPGATPISESPPAADAVSQAAPGEPELSARLEQGCRESAEAMGMDQGREKAPSLPGGESPAAGPWAEQPVQESANEPRPAGEEGGPVLGSLGARGSQDASCPPEPAGTLVPGGPWPAPGDLAPCSQQGAAGARPVAVPRSPVATGDSCGPAHLACDSSWEPGGGVGPREGPAGRSAGGAGDNNKPRGEVGAGAVLESEPSEVPASAAGPRESLPRGDSARKPDGAQEPDGAPEDGAREPDGARDPDGAQEADGARAPDGIRDPNGAQEPDGAQEDGAREPDSARDPDGAQEADGARAPDGIRDPNGAQEPDGAPEDGAQEPDGARDPDGAQEADGARAPDGIRDPNGAQEPDGAPEDGAQEPDGARDPDGAEDLGSAVGPAGAEVPADLRDPIGPEDPAGAQEAAGATDLTGEELAGPSDPARGTGPAGAPTSAGDPVGATDPGAASVRRGGRMENGGPSGESGAPLATPPEAPQPGGETPVEREIRLHQEREESLRRQRGLASPRGSQEFVELRMKPILSQAQLPAQLPKEKERQWAGAQMQREIQRERLREDALVQQGKVRGAYDRGTPQELQEKKLIFEQQPSPEPPSPRKPARLCRGTSMETPLDRGPRGPAFAEANGPAHVIILEPGTLLRPSPGQAPPERSPSGQASPFRLRSCSPQARLELEVQEAQEREQELQRLRRNLYGLALPWGAPRAAEEEEPPPRRPERPSCGKLEVTWPPPASAESPQENGLDQVQKSPRSLRQKNALIQRWETGAICNQESPE